MLHVGRGRSPNFSPPPLLQDVPVWKLVLQLCTFHFWRRSNAAYDCAEIKMNKLGSCDVTDSYKSERLYLEQIFRLRRPKTKWQEFIYIYMFFHLSLLIWFTAAAQLSTTMVILCCFFRFLPFRRPHKSPFHPLTEICSLASHFLLSINLNVIEMFWCWSRDNHRWWMRQRRGSRDSWHGVEMC